MRVRMNTTSAGPEGVLQSGREYDLPPEEARQLLQGGYATPVKPEAETAVRSAPETAAAPTRPPARKPKAPPQE